MNIECFGGKINDNTFDNGVAFNTALSKVGNKGINLLCSKGTYYFNTCIEFNTNINLIGKETIFQFNAVNKSVLIGSTDDAVTRNAIIKGITIKMTSQLFGSGLSFTEGTALRLFNIHDSLIKDINIENEIANNVCNGIWLRENCKDVVVDNCKTIITSGNNVGGSLWLWTYNSASVMENIIAKNCQFTQNTNDEIIGIWGDGTANNIYIDNNIFNENNTNHKVMTISFRACDEVKVSNNIFNSNSDVQNIVYLATTNKNYQFINNTFNINKQNLNDGVGILINTNNVKVLNNQFNSINGYIKQVFNTISGNCIITNNEFNNRLADYIIQVYKTSSNANVILSDNKISCRISPLDIRSSNPNIIKMDNNIIDLDNGNNASHLVALLRNDGTTEGSSVYISNNKVKGKTLNLVYGVGYANYVLRNNDINATTVNFVKRADQTYDITSYIAVFENNNLTATTLEDTDTWTNPTKRTFKNNILNGVDITQVANSPVNTDPYYNIFRRLIPNYQLLNATSSSVLGYKKTGDTTYVTINI